MSGSSLYGQWGAPFWQTLRHYSWRDVRSDALAALAVAPVAVPQAMAYALVAGVHPRYGVYACIFSVIVAALWGSSRFMAAGPTNAVSMILFSAVGQVSVGGVLLASMPEDIRMGYIFGIGLLAGLIQFGMGVARLGYVANFISHAVMTAFAAGAAMLLISSQLKHVLGLDLPSVRGFFPQLWQVGIHVTESSLPSLGIAVLTIVVLVVFRHVLPRLPAALVALTLATLATQVLLSRDAVRQVGTVPRSLPPLSLPPVPEIQVICDLFMPALAIAILGAVESLAVGKKLAAAKGDAFDGSQELVGQGLGNIAASISSGIPGCGSFTRSALMLVSGARTRFATVFSGVLVIPLLLLCAPLMGYIPLPALAGILLVTALDLVKWQDIRLSYRATRADRAALLTTFGAALLLDLEQAIFLGTLLSLVIFLYKQSQPRVHRLAADDALLAYAPWTRHCPDLAVFVVEGTLFFGAVSELERQMQETKLRSGVVVLHLMRVFWVDASGVHTLEQFLERCLAKSVPVVLVAGENVRPILQRSGALELLGEGFVASTLGEGLEIAHTLLRSSHCRYCLGESCPCTAL